MRRRFFLFMHQRYSLRAKTKDKNACARRLQQQAIPAAVARLHYSLLKSKRLLSAPYFCANLKKRGMRKRKASLLTAVVAGTAMGLALGTYVNSAKSPALRRRLAAHLSLRARAIGEWAFERLLQLLSIKESDVRIEASDISVKMANAPATLEEDLPSEKDALTAFTAGAERARRRLAERWAALQRL